MSEVAERSLEVVNHEQRYPVVDKTLVQIRGQVQAPGNYTYHDQASIFDYLRSAGGPTYHSVLGDLTLIRKNAGKELTYSYKLDKLHSLPKVQGGDILVFHSLFNVKTNNLTNVDRSPRSADSFHVSEKLEYHIRTPEFKRLLNMIVTTQKQHRFKSLAVLSLFPQEGRSFFVSALALGYAKLLNARVLVLDTVSQTNNRSLYLDRILDKYEPGTPESGFWQEPGHIDLMTSRGPAGGGSESTDFQIGPYVEYLRDHYDLIILDTCAITDSDIENMDPIVVARQVDTTILLTSEKSMTKESMVVVKQELDQYGIPLLGNVYHRAA